MTERYIKGTEKDKEQWNAMHPFSKKQVVFLCILLDEWVPLTAWKGKELTKKSTKEAEKPGEHMD